MSPPSFLILCEIEGRERFDPKGDNSLSLRLLHPRLVCSKNVQTRWNALTKGARTRDWKWRDRVKTSFYLPVLSFLYYPHLSSFHYRSFRFSFVKKFAFNVAGTRWRVPVDTWCPANGSVIEYPILSGEKESLLRYLLDPPQQHGEPRSKTLRVTAQEKFLSADT